MCWGRLGLIIFKVYRGMKINANHTPYICFSTIHSNVLVLFISSFVKLHICQDIMFCEMFVQQNILLISF